MVVRSCRGRGIAVLWWRGGVDVVLRNFLDNHIKWMLWRLLALSGGSLGSMASPKRSPGTEHGCDEGPGGSE